MFPCFSFKKPIFQVYENPFPTPYLFNEDINKTLRGWKKLQFGEFKSAKDGYRDQVPRMDIEIKCSRLTELDTKVLSSDCTQSIPVESTENLEE